MPQKAKFKTGSFILKINKKISLEKWKKDIFLIISHKSQTDSCELDCVNSSNVEYAELQGSIPPQQKATLNHCGVPIDFNASRKGETTAFSVNLFKGLTTLTGNLYFL